MDEVELVISGYPKWMHHPHEQPAILSDDYEHGSQPRIGYGAKPGRPRMFPPVCVNDPEQEAYHAALGYVVGESRKPAFMERAGTPIRPDIPEVKAPEFDPRFWPKWVHGEGHQSVIAKNPTEEAAILAQWAMAGAAVSVPQTSDAPPELAKAKPIQGRRWDLLRECKAKGIPADRGWKVADMERALHQVAA